MPSSILFAGEVEPVDYGQADPLIGWKMPPSTTAHESNKDFDVSYGSGESGFRRSPNPASEGAKRISFIGDSMTFGIGVEDQETFVVGLEDRLDGVATSNFGMSGFGIDQMWMTLRHYVLKENPELVVLCFILDDLNRSMTCYRKRGGWMQKPTFQIEDGQLTLMTAGNRPTALVRYIEQELHSRELARRVESRVFQTRPIGGTWTLNRAILEAMANDCQAAGIPMMAVFLIPRGETRRCSSLSAEFDALGIPFLDLQDELRADPWALYFERDRHLNTRGHALVADEIAEFIERHQLLEASSGLGND